MKIFWKIYFWFSAIWSLVVYVLLPTIYPGTVDYSDLAVIFEIIATPIVIVGLGGYAYSLNLVSNTYLRWLAFLFGVGVFIGIPIFKLSTGDLVFEDSSEALTFTAIYIFALPQYFGLYLYAKSYEENTNFDDE